MKKILLFAAFLCFLSEANAQNLTVTKTDTKDFNEQLLRQKMKDDGLSEAVIDKLIIQQKQWMQKGKNVIWSNVKNTTTPVVNASCSDMGVENGWGSWSAATGSNGSYNPPVWNAPFSPPTAPDFNITSGASFDVNTPGPNAGEPLIPVVCPGFGNYSIQLGQPCTAGCLAWQLTYPLTVTAQDTNFVYSYAIVIEDAGHAPSDQPYVEIGIYDMNGNTIPCGFSHYTGGPSMPGFYYVSGTGCGYGGTDQYKPWTTVGINLTPYIGQILNIVITNVDCDLCGHWAYSYWDFACSGSGTRCIQGLSATRRFWFRV